MTKTPTSSDWIASKVTVSTLNDFVTMGVLPPQEVIHWQVAGSECPPEPQEGEVVVFIDHLLCGFSPPAQNSSETFCIFTTFTPKTSVPTPSPINATFKCFAKCNFEKSPLLTSSEITFISTARLRCQMGPVLILEAFPFKGGEM